MLSSFVDEVDKSATSIPSFCAPEGEEALVIAAKDGNEHAFEILVERYRRRMLTVALRLTRVREDAEDIAQQSFQKAFVHLRAFEGKSSFSTWLTRITVNEALMLLRRGRRHREVSIEEGTFDSQGAASPLEIPDSNPSPETSYLQREEARILSAAMGKLRPGLRKAVELRDLGELSTEETARRMGLSISATKSTVLRGRRKLREALKQYVRSPRMPRGNCRRSHARLARSPNPYCMGLGHREGGPYGDGSVDRCIGDPCASLFHRP
jgi:RNA polymerase sigma-70 factor (ECF subfamily)